MSRKLFHSTLESDALKMISATGLIKQQLAISHFYLRGFNYLYF